MPSIICGKCHDINEANASTCQKCGARFCPSCHLVIESPSASVCPHCGKKDLSFRPGKYGAISYAGASASGAEYTAGKTFCQSCGNRIDPGVRKCPYCGQLGQRQSIMPARGEHVATHQQVDRTSYGRPSALPDEAPTRQLRCQKCGSAIPPGSSMCPKHGKYGIVVEGEPLLPGRHTGEIWGKVMEKRAAAEAAQPVPHHHTPPQDVYPQLSGGQISQPHVPEMSSPGDQRTCPQCGTPVPDRSKICPNCGWNRLPRERERNITRAEDYYRTREGAAAGQPFATYLPEQQQPYYAQLGVQPYELAYPPPPPMDIGLPYGDDKQKKRKEKRPREYEDRGAVPRARQPILPILLALIAIGAVIVLGVVFILDQMKTPPPATLPPPTNPTTTTTGKAPVISDIQYKDITRTSAVVTWKTDKKSNSIVIYCLEGGDLCENARDDSFVTDHSVKLTGLDVDKGYHITVKSRLDDNPSSPDATLEHTRILRTLGTPDTTPPKITEVKVANITSSSASISWKTDEPSTSQVGYGTSPLLGTLQPPNSDTTMTLVHDVPVYGISPQTTVFYKVISRDAAGNEAASTPATFVTLAPSGTALGNSAPEFTLNNANNSPVTLSSLRGSKVILNFWALNCQPCLNEMPHFQALHEELPNTPMLLVAGPQLGPVNANAIGAFLQDKQYTFTVLLDATGQIGSLYNISSVPQTFFIDSGGIIRKVKDGSFGGVSELKGMLNSY